MQSLLDARDKAVCGTTYRELNNLITKIQQCPFFTERPRSPEIKEVKSELHLVAFLWYSFKLLVSESSVVMNIYCC